MKKVCLPVIFLVCVVGLGAQPPKEPKESKDPPKGTGTAPELTKSELEQIDEMKVEDLKRYMSQASNSLSRDGLELLKVRSILRAYQQKAEAANKLYATDPEVQEMAKVFGSAEGKKQLGEMLSTIKDDKALDEAVTKYLKERGVTPAALQKYIDSRDAQTMLKKCDDGLKKIQAALDKPLPGLTADNLNIGGRQGLDRVEAILARLEGKVAPTETPEVSSGGDLRELLKSALK